MTPEQNTNRLAISMLYSMLFSTLLVSFPAPSFPMGVESNTGDELVSPIRQIEHATNRQRANNPRVEQTAPRAATQQRDQRGTGVDGEYRTIDGTGNSRENSNMGAASTPLKRVLVADYGDGVSSLAGQTRQSARVISNIVAVQETEPENSYHTTDYLWQWGQFLDHDIDLTDGADPAEPAGITIPVDDLYFYPDSTMSFNRSIYDPDTAPGEPRQQINEVTAWIDASNVYGSDKVRTAALREPGSARLKTSPGDLLPFNIDSLPNAGGGSETLFLAGDVRANEQAGLTALHTLFVREHNRLVAELNEKHPQWTSQAVFDKARQLVGAQMQVITYKEFLPALLGPEVMRRSIGRYEGYKRDVDASIRNVFSAAAYRFGHSALGPQILRINADGEPMAEGPLSLREAFFDPRIFTDENNLEPILRGLAGQLCQNVDVLVIDDVRNFLFGEPPSAGFDLAALNIQRGRDHGLPSYNEARRQLGLVEVKSFDEISTDPMVTTRLETAYLSIEDIDLWIGGLAEDHMPGSHLGELFTMIIAEQFAALRDGDRFWYQRTLSAEELRAISNTRLSDVIRRNTLIGSELPDDVFHLNIDDESRPPRR